MSEKAFQPSSTLDAPQDAGGGRALAPRLSPSPSVPAHGGWKEGGGGEKAQLWQPMSKMATDGATTESNGRNLGAKAQWTPTVTSCLQAVALVGQGGASQR